MPQIVKGGKNVFGWSLVQTTGKILIPKEAYNEYEFDGSEKIILLSGSSVSGGFSITSTERLKKKPLEEILSLLVYSEEKDTFQVPELNLSKHKKNRYICWVKLDKNGYFILPLKVLNVYGVKLDDKLLVVRGSGHALGFIVRGPIVETAKMHPELKIFK
jgi:bifunctional DNA-binding transcriptional regulator/antitoxin component of YhaV-PrlF toxin-antitoxin module